MIPSVLVHHVEQGLKDFLLTTFPVTTPFFSSLLEDFLAKPGTVFKGPYLDIQLPFLAGSSGTGYFPDIPMRFPAYFHQEKAFQRLSAPHPKSTIIATGTGSGKTECFVYPIVDHCLRHGGQPGIKAILVYPMNALAADQAGRLAKLIHDSGLGGHVKAGIYVGQKEDNPSATMGREWLISDKEVLRLMPPDILLTNYKMLDYLLIRPQDRPIWEQNGPETLRYLVVDELHTFDGAQGSDLGCLIRRLKSRLAIDPGWLCCVGTSATLGSEEEKEALTEYASTVFGEPFDQDAIISESRLSAGEFLENSPVSRVDIVSEENAKRLDPSAYDNYREFIEAQHGLWFGEDISGGFEDPAWRIALAEKIKEHLFFQNLLKTLGGKILGYDEIFFQLEKVTRGLKNAEDHYRLFVLSSLLCLISEARTMARIRQSDGSETEEPRPFLNVRLQLWTRELRRMVASVSKTPRLRFADDLNDEQLKTHLPLVHCRECGSMGWSGLKRLTGSSIFAELKDYYRAFFARDPKVVYLFPEVSPGDTSFSQGMFAPGARERKTGLFHLCGKCLNVTNKANLDRCPSCEDEGPILVHMPDVRIKRGGKSYSVNDCPYCGSRNSLTLVGSRAASLTSVMIVQLYSSTYNDDKKLLTFSDNVQDAAHRAGFFNGRTFRFNFRTALQKCVLETGEGKTLDALPAAFIDYWRERIDEDKYVATFLAPNMEWLSDYDHLKKRGSLPEDSALLANIDKRIGWEIASEYGFQARIGRSLEKTGSSVAYPDPERWETLLPGLLESVRNEIGSLRKIGRDMLIRFLLGFLVHLKNQGGIYFCELDSFIDSFGAPYVINRKIWTPNFGPDSRAPSFLTTKRGGRFDQLTSTGGSRYTWYQGWMEKCLFLLSPFAMSVSREFYDLVLAELVSGGVLEQKTVKADTVWGIHPRALKVSSRVMRFRCKKCGHNISVAEIESRYFENAPCQRFHCYGEYEPFQTGVDYYGKLYANGDVERIFAMEHTGLLKRTERQKLEKDFKEASGNRKPWYPNLLSCTPTLEMGIDIGDLSSLILCSVPPARSNYMQRIGRAGRRDGNALNLTVANARPHDLFFFAEPHEMLAGRIDPPGIFLNASAVLERQFTAFCFDKWIAAEPTAAVPGHMSQVLNALEPVEKSKFPHNLVHFIETNRVDLFERFVDLFKNSAAGLNDESEEQLKTFVAGERDRRGSLRYRIMKGLHNRKRERESLRKKVRTLNGKIRKKKAAPRDKNHEEELRELNMEKSALRTLIKSIGDKNTFNFFTDEGLLPNYAFPEAGVILNSLIYRKKRKVQEGGSSHETWNYEYERPAVSAIRELAPKNTFYAEGRKVRIDQVNMSVSEIENWRFCSHCSHKELLGKEEEKEVCVKCGSPMWSDAAQKRFMLRMRQVFASTSDRTSRISDDSDDREPVFYNKQMLVEFDSRFIIDAYKVDADFPFGFEFLSKVEFCEINFGERTEIGEKISIAGVELPRKGFSICRVCGKVQEDNGKPSHAFTCTARDQESDRNLIDCIYLYRRFLSEAIRILLPVSIVSESERKRQSFIAAIQLGLKKKFKGKTDHLQTTVHEEPLPDSSYKRKYLVLYDTVPGGTGYLKQLMRSENRLMEVLELALDALKSCSCNQEEDKDGCYRCLFAYRNSYNMPETSRSTATELLAEILGFRRNLVRTDNIGDIDLNIFVESELEARFLGALKLFRLEGMPLMVKNDLINGKPGYFLKVGRRAYHIEPQVKIGALDGVDVESRADFVIRSARLKDKIKPMAVFLDGFSRHRTRIGLDTAQRMALVRSGKFLVWSLTWHDVENKFKPTANNYFEDYMDPGGLPSGGNFRAFLDGFGLAPFKKAGTYNSFDLLVRFLENPEEQKWRMFMFVRALLHVDFGRFGQEDAVNEWIVDIEDMLPEKMVEAMKTSLQDGSSQDFLLGQCEHRRADGGRYLARHVVVEKSAVNPPGNPWGVRICCWLNDDEKQTSKPEFQSVWNGFLRLFNYFQFLPYCYFVTRKGVKANAYDMIELYEETVYAGLEPEEIGLARDEWDLVKEMTENRFHGLLDLLREKGWPAPEAGYELVGENGEIVACAEFGWESLKIAFLAEEEIEYRIVFEKQKWKTANLSMVLADTGKFMDMKE